ncbi:hypothetical protein [Oligoflexus tunisiensis]|uniref:hypothetical protein n=1 Tax=Oligoflexus tunisiensis TaxID=708132 RepID=UPI001C4029A7|nr:hypothetical protein [Oligoflexus tunisiensis]
MNSSDTYEIKASFTHEDRLYIDPDIDSLIVTYNIVPDIFSDPKDEYTEFHYPTDSLNLSRASAVQEISADLSLFSDMDKVREYMQGTWEVCYEDRKSVLTFDGDRYTQETTTYSNSSNCLDWYAVYQQTLSGNFELVGHDEEAANGTFKINWLMDGFQLTPLSNSVASSWNMDSLCTDVVFSAFTASSLMSKNCNLNGDGYEVFLGSNLYDRMAVYPDGLADSDFDQDGGDSPETRRTKINWNLIFKKSDSP